MSSYIGRHAEYYDVFYAEKPYQQEAAFVSTCLQRFGRGTIRMLLELACGTGRHAVEFEKLGYDVLATDYSNDMLTVARRRGERLGSQVRFAHQDMRALTLGDQRFDAVVCLFDSIGYAKTNSALSAVLTGIPDHLNPSGLLVFEFWHAAAMLKSFDPVRVRRWPVPGGELLRISETRLDCAKQLADVTYSVFDLRNDGTYSLTNETQSNRYFLVEDMRAWLERCGFKPLAFYAGFSDDENITSETWHVVAVARKTSGCEGGFS